MTRQSQDTGFTLTEILVVIGIIGVLAAILLPVMSKARESSKRLNCASNLRQVGQALTAYATENKQELPRIRWVKTPTTDLFVEPEATDPDPFAANYYNGKDAALFLLIRQGRLQPKVFICPSTNDEPEPEELNGVALANRSNFSKNQESGDGVRTRSYSYTRIYPGTQGSSKGLTNRLPTLKPDFALAADYGLPNCSNAGDRQQWKDPGALGNSMNHRQVGQNVLYADGRVTWQTTNRCGADNDNIYKGQFGISCEKETNASATDSVMEE